MFSGALGEFPAGLSEEDILAAEIASVSKKIAQLQHAIRSVKSVSERRDVGTEIGRLSTLVRSKRAELKELQADVAEPTPQQRHC